MSETIVRSRRLRKKLYVEEFAILGFEFSFTLSTLAGDEYEQFFTSLSEFATHEHLFISLGNDDQQFEGSASSAERYGNATEENRAAFEALLNTHTIVSDIKVSALLDACYGM